MTQLYWHRPDVRDRFPLLRIIGVVGLILQLAACGGGSGNSDQGATASASPTSGGDTAAPALTITTPTSASSYSTTNANITVAGNASDSGGVSRVSWSSNRGGSGNQTFSSTNVSWSFSVALQSGANVLTVTALDAAGNTRTRQLTVTRASNVATLTWDANPESDVVGYRVYFGTSPGTYQQTIEVADNSHTVTGLSSGVRYYFAVTAFDAAGNESENSREVSKDIP